MKLLRLEIAGFKSFANKTVVEFVDGITAIVGPNGSGKSNIADAVRWVLGEQSARALRGNKMEDVIFNGTQQRKPLAYCEVTLVFDNSDQKLRIDYTEVSITRRVYRSGEGEYLLNGKQCRLKDIHELFRDTGIGKEGYSIIGQGKVEEILSNKSGDRRALFEEAAGVMRFRTRKEEAERKLENTRTNLVRLNDILAELEERIEPLSQQSESAKQYLLLRDELKASELNLYLIQHERLNDRIAAQRAAAKQLEDEVTKNAAEHERLAAECIAIEETERLNNSAMSELQARLLELTAGIESNTGEANVLKEKIENARRETERLMKEQAEHEALIGLNRRLLKEMDSDGSKGDRGIAELEKSIADGEKRLSDEEAVLLEREEELNQKKQSIIDRMNRLSDAKSGLSRIDAIEATLKEQLLSLGEKEAAQIKENEQLAKELAEAQRISDESAERKLLAEKRRNEAATDRNKANNELRQMQLDIRALEQKNESLRSKTAVLHEMKQAHEGYYSSVRSVLNDAKTNPVLKNAIEGVVAELIKVPARFETAIEMTLGAALQNIVTKTEQDAKTVIEHLRRNNYGRATLLPVSSVKSRDLNRHERDLIAIKGCYGVASELVEYFPKYANVVGNLLGRTVIVEDIDTAIMLNRSTNSQIRIATVGGDIINPGGSMTGGSVQKREFSLLGREREIEELKKLQSATNSRLDEKRYEEKVLSEKLKRLQEETDRAAEAVHELDVEAATNREKLEIVKKYVLEGEQSLKRIEAERSVIEDNIEDVKAQRMEYSSQRDDIEQGNEVTQSDIRRLQTELFKQRNERDALANELTALKVQHMAAKKERDAVIAESKRLGRETERAEKLIAEVRLTAERLGEETKTMSEQLETMYADVGENREVAQAVSDEIARLENEQDERTKHLYELRSACSEITVRIDDCRERKHKSELILNKSELELENMQNRIWDDYQMTYEGISQYRRPYSASAEHQRSEELKKAIRALGEINVNAIEEYKLVKERHDNLKAQTEDLEKAREDLQKLIAELMETMKSEFKKQFAVIQQNFTSVFTELFRGGRAELILSDNEDILNCDIDIIAQPPGKKLQLMSLLSGGERALTAIALLFAILKLKPTAFCVLDEIETSLDELNVSNFAEYLHNYSRDTQFILITHRKGSMAVCNAIYGVAMEEKGVSKLVSAKFDDFAAQA